MTLARVLVAAYEVERVLFRIALLALIGKLLSEAWGAWRAARRPRTPPPEVAAWPHVTVQVPLRDEYHVAERVLRAVAQLDYPAFDIQVLDDSGDDTVARVDSVAAELRARGIAIEVVRRPQRVGAKAGALAHGLATARGDYLAVFDADFTPAPDFLRRALPHLVADARVGMVQGRWELRDRRRSWLASLQALVLDGLMLVEQPAKDVRGLPLHFNGTAGVWRRACIADAGGWSAASITEDLDLSYRAARRGWRMVHLAELAVPTELPRSMRAYRTQQKRWTRGNAQVLRTSWRAIVTAPIPARHRVAMLLRTAARSLYVLIAIATIAMPLTTFGVIPWAVDYGLAIDAAWFAALLAALYAFYLPALRRATGSWWRGAYLVPGVVALHVGLSACCAVAFLAGLVRRHAEFVRTPKYGDEDKDLGPRASGLPRSDGGPHYGVAFDGLAIVELAIGVAYAGFAALAWHRHLHVLAAFFAGWSAAHLWVGGATIPRD